MLTWVLVVSRVSNKIDVRVLTAKIVQFLLEKLLILQG